MNCFKFSRHTKMVICGQMFYSLFVCFAIKYAVIETAERKKTQKEYEQGEG